MATSGSFNSNTVNYQDGSTTIRTYWTFSWEILSQDSANLTSRIKWNVQTVQTPTGSGYVRGVRSGSKVTVDGNDYATTTQINAYNGLLVQSGETTIQHNVDGTKNFTVSFAYKIGSSSVNCTGSHTFTLDALALNPMIATKVDGSYKWGYPYVKVNGTWKKATEVYVKVNGTWKPVSKRG